MKGVVLVTGAASGLGFAIAENFAKQNYQVLLSAKNLMEAQKAKASSSYGNNMTAVKLDVESEDDFTNLLQWIDDRFSRLDVLVNNAAVTKAEPISDISIASFDKIVKINQGGVFMACQILGGYMAKKGYGRIINIASLAGQNGGTATGAHYATSKGAIITLTKIFAKQFAGNGVTVNAIAPGPLKSQTVSDIVPNERMDEFVNAIPVKKLGDVEYIADVCELLARSNAYFVTGATWDINGGLYMR